MSSIDFLKPLSASVLYRHCDPAHFDFKSTAELEDLEEIIGQSRAIEALHFGIDIQQEGYNLFVLGPPGLGKHTVVQQYLEQQAAQRAAPPDWIYVNCFDQPHKPRAIALPCGQAISFQRDMAQLIEDLRSAIPAAFESDEYHAHIQEIENTFSEQLSQSFNKLAEEAARHQVILQRTPRGFSLSPGKDNKAMTTEEFNTLSDEEKKQIHDAIEKLETKLASILRQQAKWHREIRDNIKTLNREVAMFAAGHLIDEIKSNYTEVPAIQGYLSDVLEDAIAHLDVLRSDESSSLAVQEQGGEDFFRRYAINVLVDNSATSGAPVIYEDTPTYQQLVGRVEHQPQMGMLITDFTLIKPGALHLANGGYLILDAYKLLTQDYAWEGLKRALSSHQIRIQSLGEIFSVISTVSLEPEPISLDIKLVLVGDRQLYYLLLEKDPEFGRLFKVAADFEDRVSWNEDNNMLYARLVATIARRNHLLDFEPDAVARVIEFCARSIEDNQKLTTHVLNIADLLCESDYWARKQGHTQVNRADIQQSIDSWTRRADRFREQIYEEIRRDITLIDTRGSKVAQVNGLAVIEIGDFAFAQPARITATARLGEGDVIDIEREVELGGAIHSKGVFILTAFLSARYAKNRPLSLAATLVFEQSYSGIDGDSASMAELCALLSALADTAIRQDLAITGSVNQLGQAQAIGSANEKVEGFFDVCQLSGLTGQQGVIIPRANVQHLMLREDVINAVATGKFHIYAVDNIDQAIELLTGVAAGTADEQGHYPTDTINQRVDDRLNELEHFREEYAKGAKETADEEHKSGT